MRKLIPLVVIGLMATVVFTGPASAKKPRGETAKAQIAFGVNMARRQLWNEALFRFQQAAKLDPSNPRVYNNLAVACEATGRFDEALEYYRQALRLAPSDRTVKGNYSRFIEFYQSFKPAEEDEESAGGSSEESDGTQPASESGDR